MSIVTIPYGSELYTEELDIRNKFLRVPIGLSLFDEDLSKEKDDLHFGVVDETTGTLLGCVILTILPEKKLKLRQMIVVESAQGKGLGRSLVNHCIEYARKSGDRIIELHARKTALQFYAKLGFELIEGEFMQSGLPHYSMFFTL